MGGVERPEASQSQGMPRTLSNRLPAWRMAELVGLHQELWNRRISDEVHLSTISPLLKGPFECHF